ncbi:MAG: acyl-CoA dehydrogenase family protein [Candidatus Schekmanbacteria bacterium]|nr:acyl-CoA dehydrogenase family protein [Candidatus Schekmanbacteria bacterium]
MSQSEGTASAVGIGRSDLQSWKRDHPANFFEADANLRDVLGLYLGERRETEVERLAAAGAAAAGVMNDLVIESNREENLPVLRRHDGIGRRAEEVVFHPTYHELGRQVWRTGVLAVLGEPGNEVLAGTLAYLLGQNGEGGHGCPVACTAGAIKLLQTAGTGEQKDCFLPALISDNYDRRLHASQFITEVQGGSDVGPNDMVATPCAELPGRYRLTGEKWFCSVADAGLFVASARPERAAEGTRGLGLFLVPRLLGGEVNGFSLRRLKGKIGTRSMATGEMDFAGALAEPIGRLEDGFKNLVSIVLDTSRVFNAISACGIMRRAYLEAQAFAGRRVAFGSPIAAFPGVSRTLAEMKMELHAAVATTFRLLALSDRIARGNGNDDMVAARRIHVMINKYCTAIRSSEVARDGIEILGGNGTVEEFSVLPRLYRDAIVVESWEGSHNTLCAQVLRDFSQRQMAEPWLWEVRETVEAIEGRELSDDKEVARRSLAAVSGAIEQMLGASSVEQASFLIRPVVDRMCQVNSFVSLLQELSWQQRSGLDAEDKARSVKRYRMSYLDCVDPADLRYLELNRGLSAAR